MTARQAVWLGIGIGALVFVVIAWLKGAFALVAMTYRRLAHEAGTPWTLGVAAEPVIAAVVVFFVGAVGLAHPDSRWARWFYDNERVAAARERYGEDEAAPPAARVD